MSNVASSSQPHHAPCSLAATSHRRNRIVSPTLNFGPGIANSACASSHTTTLAVTHPPAHPEPPLNPHSSSGALERPEGINSHHVVPPGLPHLQQLPALLPTSPRRCPSTSLHGRWPWWLCGLLEQPHWSQDGSFLVRYSVAMRLSRYSMRPHSTTRATPRLVKMLY
jgi:hypothetical protein